MANHIKCTILDLNLYLMDDKKLTYLYFKVIPQTCISLEIDFHAEKYENNTLPSALNSIETTALNMPTILSMHIFFEWIFLFYGIII